MAWWIIILVIIGYFFIEFITSLFFNWRLMLLTEKKFNTAGLFASISTLLFVSSVVLATWLGVDNDVSSLIVVPFVALSMGAGNFTAAVLVPKIRTYLGKRKESKE